MIKSMASNGATRQSRYAARQRDGLIVCKAVVHEVGIVAMLHDLDFLSTDDPTRAELDAALSRWIYSAMTRHCTARWPVES
jgi:hypothetical protein